MTLSLPSAKEVMALQRLERKLLAQIASGDKDAFSQLYDRLADTLFKIAYRLLGNSSRAEEVVSRIFLTLWHDGIIKTGSRIPVRSWAICRAHQFSAEMTEFEDLSPFPAQALSGQSKGNSQSCPGNCALDDILITRALRERPARPSDYNLENDALVELIRGLIVSPDSILQSLVNITCRLCRAGSAGISVAEKSEGQEVFRWRATSGEYRTLAGQTLPRYFSPCGEVLERDSTQLMAEPGRYYPYVESLKPVPEEVLLVPFSRYGRPIGTVWIVAHEKARHFDGEDARLVETLSRFAAAALHTVEFEAFER